MSEIRVNNIIDEAGTGAPTFPNGATGNLTGNVTGNTSGTAGGLTGTPNITVGTVGCSTVTSSGDVNGVNATFSGNLTVQGTTTTIDTAVTAIDSLAVDGNGTFGQASNSTGNNGVAVGGNNGSLNIYTDRYATDCFQILNTTGSGTNVALQAFGNGNLSLAGTISDSIGPLRRLDIVSSSADLTLSAALHAGRLIRMTSTNRTFTIPSGSFSSGDMITIFHVGTGNMTIAQGSSVTLYNAADGATGNRTLAAKGMVTIACTDGASNEFVISGSQLT